MRGQCKIELKDVHTSETQTIEGHNLVTTAITDAINSELLYYGTSSATNGIAKMDVIPISTNGLGGIMLFNGTIDGGSDTVLYPGLPLVGYADQSASTGNPRRGSLDSFASGATTDGYVNVWTFDTTQANGTIGCVSLTNAIYASDPLCGHMAGRGSKLLHISDSNSTTGVEPLYYDNGYLYICYQTYNQAVHFGRIDMALDRLGVNDTPISATKFIDLSDGIAASGIEPIDVDMSSDVNAISSVGQYVYGYDGYIYGVEYRYGYLYISKTDTSTWSYTAATVTPVSVDMASMRYRNMCVTHDHLYVMEDQAIYIFPFSDPANVTTVSLPTGYETLWLARYTSHYSTSPYGNGGAFCYVPIYDSTSESEYSGRMMLLREDGTYELSDESGLRITPEEAWQRTQFIKAKQPLITWASRYGVYDQVPSQTQVFVQPMPITPYIGTIYNLPQPVTKTSSQTMTITYTLTDGT